MGLVVAVAAYLAALHRTVVGLFADLATLREVYIGRGLDPCSPRGIVETVLAHFAALCQIISSVVSDSPALHGVFVGIVH